MRIDQLATLNVGNMTGRSGEIAQLMRKKSLQVLFVQNIEWKGNESEIDRCRILWRSGQEE